MKREHGLVKPRTASLKRRLHTCWNSGVRLHRHAAIPGKSQQGGIACRLIDLAGVKRGTNLTFNRQVVDQRRLATGRCPSMRCCAKLQQLTPVVGYAFCDVARGVAP